MVLPSKGTFFVETLSRKQSSLAKDSTAIPRKSFVYGEGPILVASNGKYHLSGTCGSLKRRLPTGGLAYGIPRKLINELLRAPFTATPRTGPYCVETNVSEASN